MRFLSTTLSCCYSSENTLWSSQELLKTRHPVHQNLVIQLPGIFLFRFFLSIKAYSLSYSSSYSLSYSLSFFLSFLSRDFSMTLEIAMFPIHRLTHWVWVGCHLIQLFYNRTCHFSWSQTLVFLSIQSWFTLFSRCINDIDHSPVWNLVTIFVRCLAILLLENNWVWKAIESSLRFRDQFQASWSSDCVNNKDKIWFAFSIEPLSWRIISCISNKKVIRSLIWKKTNNYPSVGMYLT